MVAIKAQQAQSFLKSVDARIAAILVFGTDAGLVSERARQAAESIAARDKPPGEILRIEDADLDSDTGRLAVELQTMAMFGGRKVVRTTASRRINANLLKPLLEPGALVGALVVEAGNLRPDETLRAMFEKPAHAAAIACYADEARDIDGIIRDTIAAAQMEITPEARQLLASRLGADRALTRAEIDKLILYAHGRKTIVPDDIDAVVGDASELAIDTILLAASGGSARRALIELDRAVSSGESPQGIITMTLRHFQRLHRLRAAIDAGQGFEQAARFVRPPLHFKTKSIIEAQCRAWDLPRLDRALAAIDKAAKDARLSGALETTITERLLLQLATMAAPRRA